jgi:hypothetical protein
MRAGETSCPSSFDAAESYQRMTTNLRQRMREMTEGYRFKEEMSRNGERSATTETAIINPSSDSSAEMAIVVNEDELIREAINHPIVEIEK